MAIIEGGYVLKPKKILSSWVALAPPVVRETWDWLLMNAHYRQTRYGGYTLERGQLFCTYKDIREGLSWRVGARKETYSESQMKRTMKALTHERMIACTKEPRGNVITICNYDYYQNPKNYERTSEQTGEHAHERIDEQTGSALSILKEVKKLNITITTAMTLDWCLDLNTRKALIEQHGIPDGFIDQELTSFIQYWFDRGDVADSWDAKFIQSCQHQWDRNRDAWEGE